MRNAKVVHVIRVHLNDALARVFDIKRSEQHDTRAQELDILALAEAINNAVQIAKRMEASYEN